MRKEEINEILEWQGVYEIVYRKDDDERIWHISNIELHKDYEGNVITAYCHELEKDINYSIFKIVSAKRYWIDILEENDVAPQSGIYLFIDAGCIMSYIGSIYTLACSSLFKVVVFKDLGKMFSICKNLYHRCYKCGTNYGK